MPKKNTLNIQSVIIYTAINSVKYGRIDCEIWKVVI